MGSLELLDVPKVSISLLEIGRVPITQRGGLASAVGANCSMNPQNHEKG